MLSFAHRINTKALEIHVREPASPDMPLGDVFPEKALGIYSKCAPQWLWNSLPTVNQLTHTCSELNLKLRSPWRLLKDSTKKNIGKMDKPLSSANSVTPIARHSNG